MSSFQVSALLGKAKDVDSDIRFMALNDLAAELQKSNFGIDAATEAQLVDQLLELLSDANAEVKNQAVKVMGYLVPKISDKKLPLILGSLTTLSVHPKDDQLRDIANLGLRTVIKEIPPTSSIGVTACTKLTPSLLEQLDKPNVSQDTMLNTAELLLELFTRFESVIRQQPEIQANAQQGLIPLLSTGKPAVKKRAIEALAQLVAAAPSDADQILPVLLDSVIHPALDNKKKAIDPVVAVSLIGAMAQRAPSRLAPYLETKSLVKKIMAVSSASSKGADAMDEDEPDEAATAAQTEASEAVLLTLERLLLKCPKEMIFHVQPAVELATPLLSWDPNFAGGDDDDDDVQMGDDDEDEDYADELSDDDDVSWKVRRAATRLLSAVIETARPELIHYLCKTVSPLLISRFSEREETVRLDIWTTYRRFLMVVGVLTGTLDPQQISGGLMISTPKAASSSGTPLRTREDTPNTLKRKRGESRVATPTLSEESPLVAIHNQAASITKPLIAQLSQKNIGVTQAAFSLLDALVAVLNGGVDDQIGVLSLRIQASLDISSTSSNLSSSSGTATSLKIVVLDFLAHLFDTYAISTFGPSLQKNLIPVLVKSTGDRFNKIASAAFNAVSVLVKNIRPITPNESSASTLDAQAGPVLAPLLEATVNLLEASGADQEVRESAIFTLGDFLFYTGDAYTSQSAKILALLKDAIKREVTRVAAVKTVARVATSPVMRSAQFSVWVKDILDDVASFLRQNNRILKSDAFSALPSLIVVAGNNLDSAIIEKVLLAVNPFISTDDLPLLPSALHTLNALIETKPQDTLASATFGKATLPAVLNVVKSSLVHVGQGLDALLVFFAVLVRGGTDPRSLVETLKQTSSRTGARCIGAVVSAQPAIVTPVAEELLKSANNSKTSGATVVFALFTLGEIGRVPSYAGYQEAFQVALGHFTSSTDEIRTAAAFALGNLAVGSTKLVSAIVKQIAASNSDDKQRALSLQALKEFIIHAKFDDLASVAESLWTPLFSICAVDGPPPVEPIPPATASAEEKKKRDARVDAEWKKNEGIREHWKETESSRNVAAECLGKIVATQPHQFLPQLQARLQDVQAGIRVAVLSALRHTLSEDTTEFDQILGANLATFLALMKDPDLDVRRVALITTNSAAHHKLNLLRDHLPSLLPLVYEQTIVNQDHIRIVVMGPFKHKVDDALEVRKAAYETCYTLLDTSLGRLDVHQLLSTVLRGISDDQEIRAICYLMLIRLAQVAPVAVASKLDSAADTFTTTLNEKLKDNAVKQEQEKHQQMQKSALRAFAALSRLSTPALTPKFANAVAAVSNNPQWASEFKDLVSESRTSTVRAMDLD